MSKLTRYFFFRMINPFFTSTNFNTVSNEGTFVAERVTTRFLNLIERKFYLGFKGGVKDHLRKGRIEAGGEKEISKVENRRRILHVTYLMRILKNRWIGLQKYLCQINIISIIVTRNIYPAARYEIIKIRGIKFFTLLYLF